MSFSLAAFNYKGWYYIGLPINYNRWFVLFFLLQHYHKKMYEVLRS